MSPTSIGLKALLPEKELAEFLSSRFPKLPFVFHGPRERLGSLLQTPEFSDFEKVLQVSPERQKRMWSSRPDDNVDHKNKNKHEQTTSFLTVHAEIPTVDDWLKAIEQDLDTPMASTSVMGFASRAGHGSGNHFDDVEAVVVQLFGRKEWTIAKCRELAYPPTGFNPAAGLAPELATLVPELPSAMPRPSETFVLEPGSFFFMPRGYYHETRALDDCFSLTFMFKTKTWADFLLENMRDRLRRDEQWREPVSFRRQDWERAAAETQRRLSEGAAGLANALLNIDANELFTGHTFPNTTYFRKNESVRASVLAENEGAPVLLIDSAGREPLRLRLNALQRKLLERLLRHEGPLNLGAARDLAPEIPFKTTMALLQFLAEVGALQVRQAGAPDWTTLDSKHLQSIKGA